MSDPAQLFIADCTPTRISPATRTVNLRERGFEAQSAAEAGLLQSDDAQQLARWRFTAHWTGDCVMTVQTPHHFAEIAADNMRRPGTHAEYHCSV